MSYLQTKTVSLDKEQKPLLEYIKQMSESDASKVAEELSDILFDQQLIAAKPQANKESNSIEYLDFEDDDSEHANIDSGYYTKIQHVYAILYCSLSAEIYPNIMLHKPPYRCFYSGEFAQKNKATSPYLVELVQNDTGSEFNDWLLSEIWGKQMMLLIHSPLDIKQLSIKLRRFNKAFNSSGAQMFFHSYLPLFCKYYLESLEAEFLNYYTQGISRFFVEMAQGRQLIQIDVDHYSLEQYSFAPPSLVYGMWQTTADHEYSFVKAKLHRLANRLLREFSEEWPIKQAPLKQCEENDYNQQHQFILKQLYDAIEMHITKETEIKNYVKSAWMLQYQLSQSQPALENYLYRRESKLNLQLAKLQAKASNLRADFESELQTLDTKENSSDADIIDASADIKGTAVKDPTKVITALNRWLDLKEKSDVLADETTEVLV